MPADFKYMVNGFEPTAGDSLIFTIVPKGDHEHDQTGIPKKPRKYIVGVRGAPDKPDFDWSGSPDDPGSAAEEIQAEITVRMGERFAWILRVNELVTSVEEWARELGWATRRVEKKLEDIRVGTHRVPALLMQADTCRVILEPVGRSGPGSEGLVDLYLLPGYDDIASIYFYKGQWRLHYVFPDGRPMATMREVEDRSFSKEAVQDVLAEMMQHAQ